MNLPIGIQDFAELRGLGCVYADKTALFAPLLHGPKYCILRRPPRFGKTLLLSALECYLSGRGDLFAGLAAEHEVAELRARPVFRFSLSGHRFECKQDVDSAFAMQLAALDKRYRTRTSGRPEARLFAMLRRAHETRGERPAVLIDDFDRPMREAISVSGREADIASALSSFYSIFRVADEHISFALLTGTQPLALPGSVDPLGNFTDISLDPRFDTICGITPDELAALTEADMGKLRTVAGGYSFSRELREVMNPDALLRTLASGAGDCNSGAIYPSALGIRPSADRYAVASLSGYQCDATDLTTPLRTGHPTDAIAALAASGVLTISTYDSTYGIYTLDYPNRRVEAAFMRGLLYELSGGSDEVFAASEFRRDVRLGRVEDFMRRLKAFFDGFPYDHVVQLERHFHNVVYVIFKALGEDTRSEVRTSAGRIDLLVQTSEFIYIMEFKLDASPRVAMRQIEDRRYAAPFAADGRAIVCIGISFSSQSRTLDSWEALMPDGRKLRG